MSGRKQKVEAAADSVAVATQAINDYGRDSEEAQSALDAAKTAVTSALAAGATTIDLHAARPGKHR